MNGHASRGRRAGRQSGAKRHRQSNVGLPGLTVGRHRQRHTARLLRVSDAGPSRTRPRAPGLASESLHGRNARGCEAAVPRSMTRCRSGQGGVWPTLPGPLTIPSRQGGRRRQEGNKRAMPSGLPATCELSHGHPSQESAGLQGLLVELPVSRRRSWQARIDSFRQAIVRNQVQEVRCSEPRRRDVAVQCQ